MAHLSYVDKRVLVVEDQRPFLLLLRGLINSLGAQSVVTAASGETAISACRKEKFDIVVSDLHLGGGKKNGFEFIEEIRLRKLVKPTTVCVIISADCERPVVLGSLEKQPDAYLIKPFSQSQLSVRLQKAYAKKTELAAVYKKLMEDDVDGAIDACREVIKAGSKHRHACTHLLAELYWRAGKYTQAEHMLKPLLMHRPQLWVMLAMGRTQFHLNHYGKAISLAQKVITSNKLSVESYDLLAKSYLAQENLTDAQSSILKALQLSPLSVERQFTACQVARANEDFVMLKNCSHAIWEQSKRTIHRNVAYFCTFVRSILDAAEHAEDKKIRNKYQQEALLALQRGRHDDGLARLDEVFDHSVFEQLINARVNYLDGKLLESKRTLAKSQRAIDDKYDSFPLYLATDSLKVMFDLGEFEDANSLYTQLSDSDFVIDENTQATLQTEIAKGRRNNVLYSKCNRAGMNLYNQGKFEAAYTEFKKAQTFAPMNTGVALNVLQCLIKLLEMRDKPSVDMLADCRQTYKLIDGMPLSQTHQRKMDTLEPDLRKYLR